MGWGGVWGLGEGSLFGELTHGITCIVCVQEVNLRHRIVGLLETEFYF